MNKIKEAMKPGVACHCKTEEEAWQLFEAMGWENHYEGKLSGLNYFWVDDCVEDGWDATDLEEWVPEAYKTIEFSDLTQPCPLIVGLRATAKAQSVDLDWLAEGVEFLVNNYRYKIEDCCTFFKAQTIRAGEWRCDDSGLRTLFKNLGQIKPVRRWSEETVKLASALLECGLESVRRAQAPGERLYVQQGGVEINILPRNFPEIEPGQSVALADIVGG